LAVMWDVRRRVGMREQKARKGRTRENGRRRPLTFVQTAGWGRKAERHPDAGWPASRDGDSRKRKNPEQAGRWTGGWGERVAVAGVMRCGRRDGVENAGGHRESLAEKKKREEGRPGSIFWQRCSLSRYATGGGLWLAGASKSGGGLISYRVRPFRT
jgi:hypothetical protein